MRRRSRRRLAGAVGDAPAAGDLSPLLSKEVIASCYAKPFDSVTPFSSYHMPVPTPSLGPVVMRLLAAPDPGAHAAAEDITTATRHGGAVHPHFALPAGRIGGDATAAGKPATGTIPLSRVSYSGRGRAELGFTRFQWIPPGFLQMDSLFAWTIIAPALMLLAAGLIPRHWANDHVEFMRWLAKTATVAAAALAVVAAVGLASKGPIDARLAVVPGLPSLNFGVYFDGLSAIMLLLISFIGAVICRYAVRYLEGDREQGRFLCWMLFTLGAVFMLVISRNLLQFAAAWIVADLGLHKLLAHHRHRPWALWAARKKLLISLLGNVVLIAALALTYVTLGSFDYADLFAKAVALREQSTANSMLVSTIGILLVLAAMTKSAQFPFHSWLPDTMEAPTPVSALMHAGIINAGGFLVIRLSPLVVLSPAALGMLAIIGAITALLGGVVMLSQTSVKRSLAFSTIAQMGFMMLQCGLGGFSAALLHIVAHSLYKAHAFLSSGSVLEQAARTQLTQARARSGRAVLVTDILAVGGAAAILGLTLTCFGIELTEKPGGIVLGFVLLLALTNLLSTFLATRVWNLSGLGVVAAVVVAFAYFASFEMIDSVLATTMSRQPLGRSAFDLAVHVVAVASFVAIFVVQNFIQSFSHLGWVQVFYVHANNGFYLDIPFRKLTGWIYGQPAAVS